MSEHSGTRPGTTPFGSGEFHGVAQRPGRARRSHAAGPGGHACACGHGEAAPAEQPVDSARCACGEGCTCGADGTASAECACGADCACGHAAGAGHRRLGFGAGLRRGLGAEVPPREGRHRRGGPKGGRGHGGHGRGHGDAHGRGHGHGHQADAASGPVEVPAERPVLAALAAAAAPAVAKPAVEAVGKAAGKAARKGAGRLLVTGVLGAAQMGLAIAAIVDISRKHPDELNGPKWFWYPAQTVNWIGPIAYFMGGRKLGS